MKSSRIKKYFVNSFLVLILFIAIAGVAGIRYFNNIWFQERTDYLTITSDFNPIEFLWSQSPYGEYVEEKDAILVLAEMEALPHKFVFQFDTGDPTTKIYRNAVESLRKVGVELNEISKDEKQYLEDLTINLGGSELRLGTLQIDETRSQLFGVADTTRAIRIGTLGADFLGRYVTEIDFKNQQIKLYQKQEKWMTANHAFTPFDFTGRRFMLPCELDGKELELFYDSGSSAFGLITIKNRYNNYSEPNTPEVTYNANRHGDPIPVRHRPTNEIMKIAGLDLPLKRVSYVDMYSNFQGLISPFTRIGGWLGNRPFLDCSLIFDTAEEEFVIVKR